MVFGDGQTLRDCVQSAIAVPSEHAQLRVRVVVRPVMLTLSAAAAAWMPARFFALVGFTAPKDAPARAALEVKTAAQANCANAADPSRRRMNRGIRRASSTRLCASSRRAPPTAFHLPPLLCGSG